MSRSVIPRRETGGDVPSQNTDSAGPRFRVECFLLCEQVAHENGKLFILGGGWNRITPTRLPMPYSFRLVIKLALSRELENQQVRLQLEVVDAFTGQRMSDPMLLTVHPSRSTDDLVGERFPLIIPLGVDLTLVLPGTYTVRLASDDGVIAATDFLVTEPRQTVDAEPEAVVGAFIAQPATANLPE